MRLDIFRKGSMRMKEKKRDETSVIITCSSVKIKNASMLEILKGNDLSNKNKEKKISSEKIKWRTLIRTKDTKEALK